MFGPGSSALAGTSDPTREREAIRLPTQVAFPDLRCYIDHPVVDWTPSSHPELFETLIKGLCVRKSAYEVSQDLWKSFNINFLAPVELAELLDSENTKKFLPPVEWFHEPTDEERVQVCCPTMAGEEAPELLSGKKWPTRDDFYIRAQELMWTNEKAYHALSRRKKDGRDPPRITNGRTFFERLEEMGQYWDTSHDEYIISMSDDDNSTLSTSNFSSEGAGQSATESTATRAVDPMDSVQATAYSPSPQLYKFTGFPYPEQPKGTYRGYRTGTGAEMSPEVRDQVVRAFIELVAWPHNLQLPHFENPPRRNWYLDVKTLRIDRTGLTRRVWRTPAGRDDARAGKVEGPVFGISCRHAGGFEEPQHRNLDMLKEVSALILLAQERARDGRRERLPAQGQWWTTEPRFAGHLIDVPGQYEMTQEEIDERENLAAEALRHPGERIRRRQADFENKIRRKMTSAQAVIRDYKDFKDPKLHWEPKATYCPVGKERHCHYDEVFLVSSLNHHISILKLRVHDAYLNFVKTGALPLALVPADWCKPTLQRSRWYNLLSPDDRAEAFRGLWAITGYMSRAEFVP